MRKKVIPIEFIANLPSEEASPEERYFGSLEPEEKEVLRDWLDQIPPERIELRRVLILKYLGLKLVRIARLMKVTEKTAAKWFDEAKSFLEPVKAGAS